MEGRAGGGGGGDRGISRPRFLWHRAYAGRARNCSSAPRRGWPGETVAARRRSGAAYWCMRVSEALPLRLRLAQRGLDGVTLLMLPAVLFIVLLFVYPFLYGLVLSFQPKQARLAGQLRKILRRPVSLSDHRQDAWSSRCR